MRGVRARRGRFTLILFSLFHVLDGFHELAENAWFWILFQLRKKNLELLAQEKGNPKVLVKLPGLNKQDHGTGSVGRVKRRAMRWVRAWKDRFTLIVCFFIIKDKEGASRRRRAEESPKRRAK